MSVALLAQLAGATTLLAIGVMLLAVGSLLLGGLTAVGGGAWLFRSIRLL